MRVELGRVVTAINHFTNRHQIDAVFVFHSIGELRNPSDMLTHYWGTFEKKPGVYCVFREQGGTVWYIGMSERDTGTRLYEWLFKKNKLSSVLADEDVVLSVVLKEQWYMAPALESYLIAHLQPALNVRGMRGAIGAEQP